MLWAARSHGSYGSHGSRTHGRSRQAEGAASPWPELGTAENRFSSPAVAATCLSGPLPEPKFQSDAFFQIMTSKATVVN